MKITPDDVTRIARLARLHLTEAERERLGGELDRILEAVARLEELDTRDVKPFRGSLPPRQVLREDSPEPGLTPDDALENAPERGQGHFKVPRILP